MSQIIRRKIIKVVLYKMKHAGSGRTAELTLDCGHVTYRKASAFRGKTAGCRECVDVARATR